MEELNDLIRGCGFCDVCSLVVIGILKQSLSSCVFVSPPVIYIVASLSELGSRRLENVVLLLAIRDRQW